MEDQPRTSLNGGELVRSTFVVLTFACVLAFVASFLLVFVFAFLSPLGAKSLPFCFATVKKMHMHGTDHFESGTRRAGRGDKEDHETTKKGWRQSRRGQLRANKCEVGSWEEE